MAESNQFRGSTTYTLSGTATRLLLPAPQHSEQTATLVFTEVGANAVIGQSATLLELPVVTAGGAPFVISGLRLAAGEVYLRATSDSPDVTVAVIVEN